MRIRAKLSRIHPSATHAHEMTTTADSKKPPSTLAPLRDPEFRMLWLAWLAPTVTMWMNDVASAWLMTTLTTAW